MARRDKFDGGSFDADALKKPDRAKRASERAQAWKDAAAQAADPKVEDYVKNAPKSSAYEEQGVYDNDSKIDKNYEEVFGSADPTQDAKARKKMEREAREKERGADRDSYYKNDKALQEEKEALEKQGFLVQNIRRRAPAPKGLQENPEDGVVKRVAKRRAQIALAGALTGLLGSVIGFFLSILPFELQHIANVFETEIGGVKDTVISYRGRILYSRAFFFRDSDLTGAQEFNGFRQRGMVSFMTGRNFRDTRLINQMEAAGFRVVPELDADGKFTGKIASIQTPDGTTTVNNASGFMREFGNDRAARAEIKRFFDTAEGPSGLSGLFWKGRASRAVYRRWRIRRFDFLRGAIDRKADDAVRRVRQALRSNTFGPDAAPDVRTRTGTSSADDPDTPDVDESSSSSTIDELRDAAFEDRDEMLDNPNNEYRLSSIRQILSELGQALPGSVMKGAIRAVSVLSVADTACEIKRILVALETGARTLRAEALAKVSGIVLANANIGTLGLNTSPETGILTTLFNRPNPETGRDGFGGGAWQWASTGIGTVFGNIRDAYSIGGGYVGNLADVNNFAEALGANATTCDIVTNIWVQGAAFAIGLVAAIFSGGTSVAGNFVAGLSGTIALEIVKLIAIPWLTRMIAGNVVSYDEYGDEMMAAIVSGYGVYNGLQSGNHALRPITVDGVGAALQQRERNIAYRQSNMSLTERYLSPKNARSFTSVASTMIPRSFTAAGTKVASLFRNPLSFLSAPASLIKGNRAFAQVAAHPQCNDDDIVDNNLATDPFCNLILSEDVVTLSVTPEENFLWMFTNDYVDEDGEPRDSNNGLRYQQYLDECVNQLDIIHIIERPDTVTTNEDYSEFENQYTNRCFFDQTAAMDDGTLREMSMEEAVALHEGNDQYTFDDLDVAMAIKHGYELEGEDGKAYASSHGASLLGRQLTELQYFRNHRRDQVIMDNMTEHWSNTFEVEYELDPVVIGGFGGPGTGVGVPIEIPTRTCENPVQITTGTANYAGEIRTQAAIPGTCIQLAAGTYNGINNIPLADNVIIEGENRDTVFLEGSGVAIAFSGDSTDATIRNITFQNYDNGGNNNSQENAPILGKRLIWGDSSTFSTGWLVDNVLIRNSIAAGVTVGHEMFVVNSQFIDNGITGISGGRFTGGLFANNFITGTGANSASGQYSNGAGIKITWTAPDPRVFIVGNNVTANLSGGIWCDLDCNNVQVSQNEVHDNVGFGIFFELSRNSIVDSNNVTNSSWDNGWNVDWGNGCLASGESQGITFSNNSVDDCPRALVVRETVRPWPGETYLMQSEINSALTAALGPEPWSGSDITFDNNIVSNSSGRWANVGVGTIIGPSSITVGDPSLGLQTTLDLSTVRFTNNTYNGVNAFWWNRQQYDYAGWQGLGQD